MADATSDSGADLQALLDATLPFAKRRLQRAGALAPFGAVMRNDGHIELVAADPGPEPSDTISVRAIQLLKSGMIDRARKGELRATMILYESIFKGDPAGPSDAITVCGDHVDGRSDVIIFCFKLGPRKRNGERPYIRGERWDMDGKREIFPRA